MKKVSLYYWQLQQVMAQLPNPERWMNNGHPPYITIAAPADEPISWSDIVETSEPSYVTMKQIPFALSKNRFIPSWIPTVEIEVQLEIAQLWY